MYTFGTTNRKHKQAPIAYGDTPYLTLTSEPLDTLSTNRSHIGAYSYTLTRKRMLRRIRRELSLKV